MIHAPLARDDGALAALAALLAKVEMKSDDLMQKAMSDQIGPRLAAVEVRLGELAIRLEKLAVLVSGIAARMVIDQRARE